MEQLNGNPSWDSFSLEQLYDPDDPATLSFLSSGSSFGEPMDNIVIKAPIVDIDESGSTYPYRYPTPEPREPSPVRPRVINSQEELDPDDDPVIQKFIRRQAKYGPRPPQADVRIKLDVTPFPFGNEPELDDFDADLAATVAAAEAAPVAQPETRPPKDFLEAMMVACRITSTLPARINSLSAVRAALAISSAATRKHRTDEAMGILFPYMRKHSSDGLVGGQTFSRGAPKKTVSRKSDAGGKRVVIGGDTSVASATKRTSVTSVSNAKKAKLSLDPRTTTAERPTFDMYEVSTRSGYVLGQMKKVLENLDVPDTPLNRTGVICEVFTYAILTAPPHATSMDSAVTASNDRSKKAAPSTHAQKEDTSDSDSDSSDSSSDTSESGSEDSQTVKKSKPTLREESARVTDMLFTRWLHIGKGRNTLPTEGRASSGYGSEDYVEVPSPEW